MAEHSPGDRRLGAAAAVLVRAAVPGGAPPDDSELLALSRGELSEQRRSEVLGHLNSHPEIYRRWMHAIDEQPGSARRWQAPGWIGLAVAAGFGVLAILPMMSDYGGRRAESYYESDGFRSLTAATDYTRWPVAPRDNSARSAGGAAGGDAAGEASAGFFRAAFAAGVATAFEGVAAADAVRAEMLRAALPAASEACRAGPAAVSVACLAGGELGTWSARSFVLCNSKSSTQAAALRWQREELDRLRAAFRADAALVDIANNLDGLSEAWPTADTTPGPAACEELRRMIFQWSAGR
jgi:hypothetical protein